LPARVLETATREGRYEAEGWRVRKDGSRFWASVVVDAIRTPKGDLIGFAKVTRDITERRAAQEALRESERQFRLLVAGVTDYALFMLDPNGIVTSWNVGAERIKGYRAEEIIGHHFSRFYPERDRAAGAPARALQTATQEGRAETEGWRMRKDGTLFWANAVIDAVHDEQGRLIGFAKITRDITERRKAQLALEEAQLQRAHAQKMEALGKLTGGVAHDFNNLLMVVAGHVQTIKKQLGEDPRVTRAAEAIEVAAKRGAALTRQLLTFSRRQAIQPIVVSVEERLETLRNMLASSFEGAAKLTTIVGPQVWRIRVDPNEFELALVNVILNARDALPKGGVITVSAENVVLVPTDTEQRLQGEFVALRISDTGTGIAPDVLPKVFDPFFTTKDASRGSGLGLSQVHGFVHQSGGTVTIASDLGKGTTVTLYFPRSRDDVTLEVTTPDVENVSGGRVLVVEDNPDVTDVTVNMLEQLGYAVDAVGDAAAALDRLARHEYELVVADIVMPGEMDGVKLAEMLRERNPDLPVLLVTGYSEALRHGTREFTVLRKPFELSELSRAAANLIATAKLADTGNLVRLKDARASREHKPDKKK
jgi:PAS domain S-box-containing protein